MDGVRILGPASDALNYPGAGVVVCVGSGAGARPDRGPAGRTRTRDRRYATVVDPSVRIPDGCAIGRGSVLLGHVTLTAGVTWVSTWWSCPA